jgi:hypothetical protein
MGNNISAEEFKTLQVDMKGYRKKTINDLIDKILELTKEDPTVYTAGGNRARLLMIRGNAQALKGKKLN